MWKISRGGHVRRIAIAISFALFAACGGTDEPDDDANTVSRFILPAPAGRDHDGLAGGCGITDTSQYLGDYRA
jgi:hypothetical protein